MIINGDIAKSAGFEFATFRLKDGVSEQTLVRLSREVESAFLRQQSELVFHCLLRGKEGIYADLAIASTQQKAEEYCQQWLDNPVALEYLELLDNESVNMTFWTSIN